MTLPVSSCHCEDSNKQEDHQLSHVGEHVGRLSDGQTGGLADVLLHVVLHGDAAEGDGEDPRHVEGLRGEIGEVGEYYDNQWLYHSRVVEKSKNIGEYLSAQYFQVNVDLVKKAQRYPMMIPIRVPPPATTAKLAMPSPTSPDVTFSSPISQKDSNM